MYLVRTSDFRSPSVHNETHALPSRYPWYGGELFEKRVDSWMRNHGFHLITYRGASYEHRNFPSGGLRRNVALLLERTGSVTRGSM